MTRRILARLKAVPVEVIQDREALKTLGRDRAAWLTQAKTTLLLAVQKGPFWRACPGTKDYVCCGYQVLQVTLNCPMDCTYCVLQGYVNVPAITVFVNVEDMLEELEARWAEQSGAGLAPRHRGIRRQPGPGRSHGSQRVADSPVCRSEAGHPGDQEQVATA